MSEPKLISPLLDGFAMGEAIFDHDGVRCCPAMPIDSDKKYIVKIISVPASQKELDALMLSGAFDTTRGAHAYFQDVAEDILKEHEALTRLAKADGFIAYEGAQCVPMEEMPGFCVYFLGAYRRSLARQFRHTPMTHLGAVNMGLDLCDALSVCRRAGLLYVDLKPGNVFVNENGSYQIGDIGFLPMNALKFKSMPPRCRSRWTAPEVLDAMATLNPTVDIYALGLLLYQAYNNGELPFGDQAPAEVLPPPMYADYEMAEIILKACAPDPADRWQEPMEMRQALVDYMQRNGVNDTPIVPPPVVEPEPPEAENQEPSPDAPGEADTQTVPAPAEDLRDIYELMADGTIPGEDEQDALLSADLTQEGSEMLAQADELLSHETPGPAVAPEPVDIPTPELVLPEISEDLLLPPMEDDVPEEPEEPAGKRKPPVPPEVRAERRKHARRTIKRVCTTVIVVALLTALAFGTWYGYQQFYLQDLTGVTLEGFEDNLTVHVACEADEHLLSVILTDTFGNSKTAPVVQGSAVFAELSPNSQYSVEVVISGLHKLKGTTTYTYATQTRTNIVSFSATAGAEDGTVTLNFTVDGQEGSSWAVRYGAEGVAEQTTTFDGHMVTLSGLTVDKTYTFTLLPPEGIYLVGNDQLSWYVAPVVQAENLAVTAMTDNSLTVSWNAPAGTNVETWLVRCYSDGGYDETVQTGENTIVLENLNLASAHTIEVTAQGMTVCSRAFISANPVSITTVHGDNSDPSQIGLRWEYVGIAPADGWLLMYSIDGSENVQVVRCKDASAVLAPAIPGSRYTFTIQPANGATVFGGSFSAETPEAAPFAGYGISMSDFKVQMCRTPEKADWDHTDVSAEDYTTTFAPGESASLVLSTLHTYNVAYDDITAAFIIRNEAGEVVRSDTSTARWVDMWWKGYCELDVPTMPTEPGNYTLLLLFNGAKAGELTFTVAQPEA